MKCINALYEALSAGFLVFLEKCSKCGADHLDQGVFAMKAYKKHVVTCVTALLR